MPSPKSKARPKASSTPALEWTFSAIGTEWWIGIYESVSEARLNKLKKRISKRIDSYDKTYSRFRPDSLVTRISHQAGVYDFPADAARLLSFYRQLYDVSKGQVTPMIGQLLADAGYDANYSLVPGKPRPAPKWDEVIAIRDHQLEAKRPVLLDFGAAGKGYLVDIVSDILHQAGINRFCVDAGGDMYCHGLGQPLKVGLEDPRDSSQIIGTANITNGSICASAGNRRAWAAYHHIIHPITMKAVNTVQAVWVMADDALTADGLATTLFFVPASKLLPHYSFAYCLIDANNTIQRSANFEAELFTKGA